ncbi:MAG: AlwI restriction endonuclease [Firmicutes bacterium ADurb.Bin300]|nr:MAG: AlwI restriction endonuclease [Firmicutes bacterium ADurb.Bin300]
MDVFWSASTTMRNPERTLNFLKTAAEIEGEVWNDDTQCKYQTLLIKNRYYTPTHKNLTDELYALVTNYAHEMTFTEADQIFWQKQYVDPDMRGRTSFDPLEKLGLVSLDENEDGVKHVRITGFGRMFLNGEISLGDVVFTSLLKTQFPNPLEDGRKDYNIKPFIGTLRLIKRVNELCAIQEINAVGVSREEFGIFVLSLKSYLDIDHVASRIIAFRLTKRSLLTEEEKTDFVHNYISDYLRNFHNPHKNIKEYTDNIIRYLRLTKYIYVRGGGYYIDLEPRRMIEINAILSIDLGAASAFTKIEYKQYIGDYNAYTLPFETTDALTEIARRIIDENNAIAASLGIETRAIEIPAMTDELRRIIAELREQRTELQNLQIRREYQDAQRIDEAITALSNTLNRNVRGANRPSVELEKWANIALSILNDATLIKPNAPLGDDNEPTFTAPAGVPDIECYYEGFGAICEVTMLTGRDQWYNEGQPVMRHLRSFEQANDTHENYCLFVAPRLHADTVNTFWTAVKYEYEGQRQKIIPITITELIDILSAVRNVKAAQRAFHKEDIQRLYDRCVDISTVNDSTRWKEHIGNTINDWAAALA